MIYNGFRTVKGARVRVSRDGGLHWTPLRPRLDIMRKSPTGLEWGYGGSGPGQLAIALLADAFDAKIRAAKERVLFLYQHFKWARVARFDRYGFVITKADVLATATLLEIKIAAKVWRELEGTS